MTLFVLSLIVFVLAIAGLGIGAMLGRKPLCGSCGGNAASKMCRFCPRKDRR
jgi:hypothetical protein